MVARDDRGQRRGVNKIAADFNASQNEYKVVPVFKGSYAETMNAGIAAFRAGKAPDIVQIFEVGTATMMAAKGAMMPVYQLMNDAGEPFDPNAYLPAVTGYYSTADGKMLSMPFNSSTRDRLLEQGSIQKSRARPRQAAQDLARNLRCRRRSCAPLGCLRLHRGLGQLDPDRAISAPGTTSRSPPRPTGSTALTLGSNSTIRPSSAISPISPRRKRTRASITAAARASPKASS